MHQYNSYANFIAQSLNYDLNVFERFKRFIYQTFSGNKIKTFIEHTQYYEQNVKKFYGNNI